MIKAILDPQFQPMVKVVADYRAAVLAHKNGPDEGLIRSHLAEYRW